MFTLDQLRDLCQEVDDHFMKITQTANENVNDPSNSVRGILLKLESAFSNMFEKDRSPINKNHFTFCCNDKIFAIYFYQNMLTINCCDHLLSSQKISHIPLIFDQFTPVHEFIFNNCNPEGAFLLEKVLFKEHL